jgi:hypothetical protein
VLSAPISSGLLRPWILTNNSPSAYGLKGYVEQPHIWTITSKHLTYYSEQGPLIIFTGVALLVSCLGITYRSFENTPLKWPTGNRIRRGLHA